jgi:hypothetical protein
MTTAAVLPRSPASKAWHTFCLADSCSAALYCGAEGAGGGPTGGGDVFTIAAVMTAVIAMAATTRTLNAAMIGHRRGPAPRGGGGAGI